MERNEYTSTVPFVVRLPPAQIDFLRGLGRGNGAQFIREAIAKVIVEELQAAQGGERES